MIRLYLNTCFQDLIWLCVIIVLYIVHPEYNEFYSLVPPPLVTHSQPGGGCLWQVLGLLDASESKLWKPPGWEVCCPAGWKCLHLTRVMKPWFYQYVWKMYNVSTGKMCDVLWCMAVGKMMHDVFFPSRVQSSCGFASKTSVNVEL